MTTNKRLCSWINSTTELIFIKYHNKEWGKEVHNDKKLFEMLLLEGAQAGLKWITILKKRKGYRKAFDNFNANKISKYDSKKINTLLQDSNIIRNKAKINAFITNAKCYLKIKEEFGSFDSYIWSFVNGEPIINNLTSHLKIQNKTDCSENMSKDLKKRGFKFVGPKICYAFMQACGLVNDHEKTCYYKYN